QAFARIKDEHPDWSLVLAGSGGDVSYEQKLHQLADELEISEKTCWLGYVSGEEKWLALSTADIFVLPSSSESFGIAAAEALASGCASILSDGIPFASDAEAAGGARIVKCEVGSLTEALKSLCGNPHERQTLSKNG